MEHGADSTQSRRVEALAVGNIGRRGQLSLVTVIASAIAITSLLGAVIQKNIRKQPYPEGTLEISWTVLVIRSIEMPLLACLIFAVVKANPKLARPWLLWSPIATLAEGLNRIMLLRITLIAVEMRKKYDEEYNTAQDVALSVIWGIAFFLGQAACVLAIWEWTSSTLPSSEQSVPPAITLDKERTDRRVGVV